MTTPRALDRAPAPPPALAAALVGLLAFALATCAPRPTPSRGVGGDAGGPRVVVTTGIVGDVVAGVGGDQIRLDVLVPAGSDAHAFVPTPQDLVAVAEADVVFGVGLGLEAFLGDLVEASDGPEPVLLGELDGGDALGDPHVWLDVSRVARWPEPIAEALGAVDPVGAAGYRERAEGQAQALMALDAEVAGVLAPIPLARRALATDHLALGAFCTRYGCRIVGAIVPSPSSEGSASPRGLAALETAMRREGATVVAVDRGGSARAAERLAEAVGGQVVRLDIEALGPPGSEAGTYAGLMRSNAAALAEGLR